MPAKKLQKLSIDYAYLYGKASVSSAINLFLCLTLKFCTTFFRPIAAPVEPFFVELLWLFLVTPT